jgi:hypothetical protein
MTMTYAATGAAARCASSSSDQKLSASDFYAPLIHTLAYLTGYQANTPVPMDDAITHVKGLMGLGDLGDFASGRDKVNRWVQWAHRNQREGYCRKDETPKTVTLGRGLWGLTEEGVALARSIESDFAKEKEKPLTTAEWFEVQIRDRALARRCAYLLKRNHPEEDLEVLLSHVGLWFSIWGANGYCDEKIAEGYPPTVTILTKWLEHKWRHLDYRRAKDALHREVGKRTQSEVRHKQDHGLTDYVTPEALLLEPDAPEVAWKSTGEEDSSVERDFVDPGVDPLSTMYLDDRKGLARDVITVLRARNPERYVRMFDHWIEGRTKEETAEIEECSELRVSHLFQRVRDDLKQAPVLIEVAMKVLAHVADEPWSTDSEIAQEIQDKSDRARALNLLRLRGLISEGKGSSFAPTEAGWAAVEMGSLV